MEASRLSHFASSVKESILAIWKSVVVQSERGRRWLNAPRGPVDWKATRANVASALRLPRTNTSRLLASAIVFVVLMVLAILIPVAWRWYSDERIINNTVTYPHANLVNPVVTAIGAVLLIGAAIGQARTATKQAAIAAQQAQTAGQRHKEQTDADRQRRLAESFSKAIEQLGSDKLEVRLGGIYSLERISKESPGDYWTVMENLTAFVRERSRRNEVSQDFEQRVSRRANFLWRNAGRPDGRAEEFWAEAVKREELPETDIVAVLTAIKRRSEDNWEKESTEGWKLNLSGVVSKQAQLSKTNLQGADLSGAYLEMADFSCAHLEDADLRGAYLGGADFSFAHLEGADLRGAYLGVANFSYAHLEGVDLRGAYLNGITLEGVFGRKISLEGAHLEKVNFREADLEGANFVRAYLEGADFYNAHLDGADFQYARLDGASLWIAHLGKGANLSYAHLEKADLRHAHLEGAYLWGTHLQGAKLISAHLKWADPQGAHLEGASLVDAKDLSSGQLLYAHGDASTELPERIGRPAHWLESGSVTT